MPCDICKRDDLGMHEGIRLTLVCPRCCLRRVNEEGNSTVCFSKARASFPQIPPKRLETLGCAARRNPHYGNAAPMRLYAVAELEVLAQRIDLEEWIKTERLGAERQARLERMVRLHKISPASPIHRALFEHIFGDYLRKKKPTRKLKELRFRFKVHDLSVQLCPLDPVCAMNFLENRKIVAGNYEQILADFEYSLFLSARVFRLEGLSISRYICPTQLIDMENGPLAEIPRCVDRLRKNTPRMLRMCLQNLGFGKPEVEEMMHSIAMKTRIKRCVKYAHDPETVANKMAAFWFARNDPVRRRRVLETAMEEKGLDIRRDSAYCHDFIHGEIDVDLDEIVGIQYITREIFEHGGPRLWSRVHHSCESAFRESLLEKGKDMRTSIKVGLQNISRGRRY